MAKTKTPPPEIKALRDEYDKAATALWAKVEKAKMGGKAFEFYEDMARAADAQIAALDKFTAKWATQLVIGNKQKAAKAALEAVRREVVPLSDIAVNAKVADNLAENIADSFSRANHYAGRKIADTVRTVTLESIGQKTLQGLTLPETKRMLLDRFAQAGVLTIADKNGRSIPLPAYAEMVARSTYAEVVNTATAEEVVAVGGDLVQMSNHASTCPVCAMYEGRVYSITGKTPGYPKLEDVFSGGYANIHPNCIHTLTPYFREFDDNADALQAFSSRPFEQDAYTQKAIEGYRGAQAKAAALNRDRKQWAQMVQALGSAAPKTLSAFRSIKKAAGPKWASLVDAMHAKGYSLNPKGIKLTPMTGPVHPLGAKWTPPIKPKAEYMTAKKKAALAKAETARERRVKRAADAAGLPEGAGIPAPAMQAFAREMKAARAARRVEIPTAGPAETKAALAQAAEAAYGPGVNWTVYAENVYNEKGIEIAKKTASTLRASVSSKAPDWSDPALQDAMKKWYVDITFSTPTPEQLKILGEQYAMKTLDEQLLFLGKITNVPSSKLVPKPVPGAHFLSAKGVSDPELLDLMDMSEFHGWENGAQAYGGVIFDGAGRVLLREPANHYGGYVWTWPKGQQTGGLSAARTAVKEIGEETGEVVELIGALPGTFKGSTSSATGMFVARSTGTNKALMDAETWGTKWVTFDEAKTLLAQSTSAAGVKRDLDILEAAENWWNAAGKSVAHTGFADVVDAAKNTLASPAYKAKKAAALAQSQVDALDRWLEAVKHDYIATNGSAPSAIFMSIAKGNGSRMTKDVLLENAKKLTESAAKKAGVGAAQKIPVDTVEARAKAYVTAKIQGYIDGMPNASAQTVANMFSPVIWADAEAAGVDIAQVLSVLPGGVKVAKVPKFMVDSSKANFAKKYGAAAAKIPPPPAPVPIKTAMDEFHEIVKQNKGLSINNVAAKFPQKLKQAFVAEGKTPEQITAMMKSMGFKGSIGPKNAWHVDTPAPLAPPTAKLPKVDLPGPEKLTYSKSGASLGGAGKKDIYTTADGKEYLFKPSIEKDGSTAALYKAHAQESASKVHMIVSGDDAIPIRTIELGGQKGTLQPLAKLGPDQNIVADFQASPKVKLTADQIEQLQREHVTDWLIGNFDSHGKNFLMTDSGRIVGVDKEQAFRYLGNPESLTMSYDYHPNAKYGENEPVYNVLFRRFAKNELELDPQATLKYIKKVEAIGDSEYREMWRGYAEALSGKGKTAEEMLDNILKRKQSLRGDYETFFSQIMTERTGSPVTFKFEPNVAAGSPMTRFVPPTALDETRYQYVWESKYGVGTRNTRPENLKHYEKFQKVKAEYQEALTEYTGSYYNQMNTEIRKGKISERSRKAIAAFDQMGSLPLEQDTLMLRHIYTDALGEAYSPEVGRLATRVWAARDNAGIDELKQKLIGTTYKDEAFQSTSYRHGIFLKSSNGVELRMYLPKGYDRGVFAEHFSENAGEQEYIIRPGQKFRVMDVTKEQVASDAQGLRKDTWNIVIKLAPED